MTLHAEDLDFLGGDLVRPECLLATRAGKLYAADWRGGVTKIAPDGQQSLILASSGPEAGPVPIKPNGIAMEPDGSFLLANLGDAGGLWRLRGRSPQKMTGVGFASEGMDNCVPYNRMPDSYDPACAWVFDGVENERFGDYGLALGGAGGLEIDRYELGLGTPPNTYLLATTEPFTDNYPHVVEEIMFNLPGTGGTQDFQVRGDMTLVTSPSGGAVFSSGSIAWGQALPVNGCDNDCARITANVLRRFSGDGPLG